MTTDALLWTIFALLWVALVLVIASARRGPWKRPMRCDVFDVPPARSYPLEEIQANAGPLFGHPVLYVQPSHVRKVDPPPEGIFNVADLLEKR